MADEPQGLLSSEATTLDILDSAQAIESSLRTQVRRWRASPENVYMSDMLHAVAALSGLAERLIALHQHHLTPAPTPPSPPPVPKEEESEDGKPHALRRK